MMNQNRNQPTPKPSKLRANEQSHNLINQGSGSIMMSLRCIVVVLSAFCLTLSVWSARFALADYYFEQSKNAYDALDFVQVRYASELTDTISDIDRSLALRKRNANALDFKADLLYQSWWLSPDAQYLENSKVLQEAVELHHEAWLVRENWSFSAARLALIYSHAKELGATFARWFSLSHKLGLYETKVARSMMHLGLKNWGRLSLEQRRLTIGFIGASIEQKSNNTLQISRLLAEHGKLEYVCASLSETSRTSEVCRT